MPSLRYVYLHGFASGPGSTKSRYFSEQLTTRGITPVVPNLNVPTFQEMTLSSQIDHVGSIVDGDENFVAIGSSMGGLVAALSSTRYSNIKALVLLAPGFGIEKRWMNLVDDEKRSNWRANGAIDVFHYATEQQELLNYQFVEDLESFNTRNIRVSVPTMILHGVKDDVVPIGESRSFKANNNDNVQLIELDDTHDLIQSLPAIWSHAQDFFTLNKLWQQQLSSSSLD